VAATKSSSSSSQKVKDPKQAKGADPAVKATAPAIPENPPEVQAQKDGLAPHQPYSPQVAVSNEVISDDMREQVRKAHDALVKAEDTASSGRDAGAIVALRTARRSLGALAGVQRDDEDDAQD
jgi:hypothetical protein